MDFFVQDDIKWLKVHAQLVMLNFIFLCNRFYKKIFTSASCFQDKLFIIVNSW